MTSAEIAFQTDQELAGLILLGGTTVNEEAWAEHFAGRRHLPIFIAHGRARRRVAVCDHGAVPGALEGRRHERHVVPFDGGHGIPDDVVIARAERVPCRERSFQRDTPLNCGVRWSYNSRPGEIDVLHFTMDRRAGGSVWPWPSRWFRRRAQQARKVDDATLLKPADGDWVGYGRDYAETHHSPLTQIDQSNVSRLGLAWSVEVGSDGKLETTPLVFNGVLYGTSTWSQVYAIDLRTGKVKWQWDPALVRGGFEGMGPRAVLRSGESRRGAL